MAEIYVGREVDMDLVFGLEGPLVLLMHRIAQAFLPRKQLRVLPCNGLRSKGQAP
jgi:hypothetical protein